MKKLLGLLLIIPALFSCHGWDRSSKFPFKPKGIFYDDGKYFAQQYYSIVQSVDGG